MTPGKMALAPSSRPDTPSMEMKKTSSTPLFYLIEYLHPVILALRGIHPQSEYFLMALHIVAQDGVNGLFPGFIVASDRDIHTVDKHKRIALLQRPVSPFFHFRKYRIGDITYHLVGDGEAVDLFDRRGDVSLAHSSGIHRKYLVFDE